MPKASRWAWSVQATEALRRHARSRLRRGASALSIRGSLTNRAFQQFEPGTATSLAALSSLQGSPRFVIQAYEPHFRPIRP
jgi:hypothetical protein